MPVDWSNSYLVRLRAVRIVATVLHQWAQGPHVLRELLVQIDLALLTGCHLGDEDRLAPLDVSIDTRDLAAGQASFSLDACSGVSPISAWVDPVPNVGRCWPR